MPDPGDVLAALRQPAGRVQVRLPQGLPQRPARPHEMQGLRGTRLTPLRPQIGHQEQCWADFKFQLLYTESYPFHQRHEVRTAVLKKSFC